MRIGREGILVTRGRAACFVSHSKIVDASVRPHPDTPKERFAVLVITVDDGTGGEETVELQEVEDVRGACEATRAGGFRSEPITPEVLVSIASDPRATPKVRVAAAAVAIRISPEVAAEAIEEAAASATREELASALRAATRGRVRLDGVL